MQTDPMSFKVKIRQTIVVNDPSNSNYDQLTLRQDTAQDVPVTNYQKERRFLLFDDHSCRIIDRFSNFADVSVRFRPLFLFFIDDLFADFRS